MYGFVLKSALWVQMEGHTFTPLGAKLCPQLFPQQSRFHPAGGVETTLLWAHVGRLGMCCLLLSSALFLAGGLEAAAFQC